MSIKNKSHVEPLGPAVNAIIMDGGYLQDNHLVHKSEKFCFAFPCDKTVLGAITPDLLPLIYAYCKACRCPGTHHIKHFF